eukprot:TRINITY_DN49586_c0_g1_i1.p1 TRINITY_DN49586_c0_g1~~TRINITY_DN49586_c0_g1_i1.p1  ORF type:complete len:1026 (-),score=290.04 TRINITY_DN49586_c0_g1_i1:47-3124(-)
MEEAGLLNSMSPEDLRVTCERLQRSCKDMEMLLNEFVEEQAMLRQEQDRLHQRVQKATAKIKQGRQDQGFIGNLLNDMELQLEASNLLSNIFRAKKEQQVARRRGWTAVGDSITTGSCKSVVTEGEDEELCSPFSETNLAISWACDVACGKLHEPELKDNSMTELARWVREAMCGDPVAEAEALPDAMWAAQLAASQAMRLPEGTPGSKHRTPGASPAEGLGGLAFFSEYPSGSPRPDSPQPRSASRPKVEFGPDGLQVSPDASGGEDNTPFDTLVGSAMGIVSAVGGQQVAQQVFQKVAAAQEVAQQARAAAKAGGDGYGSGADAPAAAPSYSRRLLEASSVINFFADWAAGNTATGVSTSRGEEMAMVSLTVHLKRADGQKWGLAWVKAGFSKNTERVVEYLVADGLADQWNRQQEQAGHPELCIRPMDRLKAANRKTHFDEVTAELAGREVVLEFQRLVPPSFDEQEVSEQKTEGLGTATNRSISLREARRNKTKAAFSAYMQQKAPGSFSPEKPIPEGREAEVAEEMPAAEAEEESLHTPSRPTRESLLQEVLAGCEEEEVEDNEEAADKRDVCEVPYGVMAQVTSLGGGAIRLSWLFDWESAPAELRGEVWAEQGFEVQHSSGEAEEEHEVLRFSKPPASLSLPTGRKHRLQVRALLVDNRGADESSPLWSSPLSAAVAADLRTPGSTSAPSMPKAAPAAAKGVEEAAIAGSPTSAAASAQTEGKVREAAVEATATPQPEANSLRPKPKGRVAAAFGDFLAKRPASGQPSTPAAASGPSSPKKVVMGGSALAPSSQASKDPLSSAQPVVVSAKPLDPLAEKLEMSQRLRLRGGHPGSQQRSSALDTKPRSMSFDSDDEDSLAKMCSALSSLEKTQAALRQRDSEAVAQEGHHSLQQRLDGSSNSQEPLRVASAPSSASAAPASSSPNEESLEAAISTTGHAGREAAAPSSEVFFCLRVQLANDDTAILEFRPDEDLPRLVANLVAKHSMRAQCEKPLLERAEQLLRSGKSEDKVDIIDLL